MMQKISTVALFLCYACTVVYGYGTGAPVKACGELSPVHRGVTPQAGAPPYTITVSAIEWSPSGTITVSITPTGSRTINGFILQAKKTNGEGIGMFDASSLPAGSQAGPCQLNGNMISVTHTNSDSKTTPLEFQWKLDDAAGYTGDIQFQGAVAVEHSTYWNNIRSPTISMAPATTAAAPTAGAPTAGAPTAGANTPAAATDTPAAGTGTPAAGTGTPAAVTSTTSTTTTEGMDHEGHDHEGHDHDGGDDDKDNASVHLSFNTAYLVCVSAFCAVFIHHHY